MKIGVISNSTGCIPLLGFLAGKTDVYFYMGRSMENNYAGLYAFCNANAVNLFAEEQKDDLYQWAKNCQPDMLFVSGYSSLIAIEKLGSVPGGIFNIHYGALPAYRGPSPLFWSLKNGEPFLTLTIHRLSETFDSGDVVWEYSFQNQDHYTFNTASDLFSNLQTSGVQEIIYKYINGAALSERKQNKEDARYYNKPQLNDVLIDWDAPARQIIDLIKACNTWNKGAITVINQLELKVVDAEILEGIFFTTPPGTIHITENKFFVSTADNKLLKVNAFYLNNTYIPARFAKHYGIDSGQTFTGAKVSGQYRVADGPQESIENM